MTSKERDWRSGCECNRAGLCYRCQAADEIERLQRKSEEHLTQNLIRWLSAYVENPCDDVAWDEVKSALAAVKACTSQPKSAEDDEIESPEIEKIATYRCVAVEKPGECCPDPSQCWEPCGGLGKSEEHVRVSTRDEPKPQNERKRFGFPNRERDKEKDMERLRDLGSPLSIEPSCDPDYDEEGGECGWSEKEKS